MRKSLRSVVKRTEAAPVIGFDAERASQRVRSARDAAAKKPSDVKLALRLQRCAQKGVAALVAAMAAAQKAGAVLPSREALTRGNWSVGLIDAPEGEAYREAAPAVVVKIEGNSPLARMGRAGVLTEAQLRAAEKLASLHASAVKGPRVTASYDGVGAGSGKAPAPWIDVTCDAWRHMERALEQLLPAEVHVVREVVVYETPLEALAKRPEIAKMKQQQRAYGAVVQLLSSGLDRLQNHWGLDVGDTHGG
jgi:hypothetical protein